MKRIILAFVLLVVMAVRTQGEINPYWDSIVVTTSDAGQLITIHATRGDGRLTNLVVNVGTNSLCVPQSELKDTPDPQLHSLRFGYWNKDLKQFYVALTCGRLNSFPHGKQPQDVVFYFGNGAFLRKEMSPTPRRKDNLTEPSPGN